MNIASKLWLATVTTAMAASSLAAQEAMSIDQKVNDVFAASTGWFVNFIFYVIARH